MDRTDTTPDVFAALADGHRRQILGWLREGPLSVGQLVERLPLSQPGVTKHLGVLERAGLIRREARGRERLCHLEPGGLEPLDAWLAGYRVFWSDALDRIAAMAEEPPHERERHDDRPDDRPDVRPDHRDRDP